MAADSRLVPTSHGSLDSLATLALPNIAAERCFLLGSAILSIGDGH